MNLRFVRYFALTFGFAITSLSCIAQIYVSPNGSDAAPGTKDKPLQTLERATALAEKSLHNASGDVTVYLTGGLYRLAKPLVLGSEDSGRNGHNLAFAAVHGQRPIVGGSQRIVDWQPFNASRNIWTAHVPEGVPAARQLYINGVRATRTHGHLPVALTMTAAGYTAANAIMASWKHPEDLEFVYTGGDAVWSEPSVGLGPWTEPRCPVASIEGATIIMAQPCWKNSTQRNMLPDWKRPANLVGQQSLGKNPSYVENAFELLGTPGQFYLDHSTSTIYYTPRPGENLDTADVELPVLQTLVDIEGTPAHPVHNIVFSGVQFSYASWLGPNGPDGFSEIQAGYQVTGPEGYAQQGLCTLVPGGTCPYGAWTKEPGNVRLSFTHNIHFVRDAFVHLGAAGLDLGDGAQNDVVEGSVFTDISGNGLELAGVAAPLAPSAEFAIGNRIENNLFEDVGAEFRGGIGVVIGYARNTLVSHNQMDHIPYDGISIGWGGWLDKIQKAGQANNSAHNVIEDNLIHHNMLVLSDGGGIYTQGRTGKTLADGERVIGNVVYDQYSAGHAIYTDNGSAMITVSGNVVLHTSHDWGHPHRSWYDGNNGKSFDPLLIEDNYWQQGDADSSKGDVTVRGNHIINSLDEAPKSILQNAGLQPAYRDILALRFSVPAPPEPPSRVAAWASNGFALITWNPSVAQGSSPITEYMVRSSSGASIGISAENFWKLAYVKFTGLPNGKPVTFTVSAVNGQGESVASMPSADVTPEDRTIDLPAAPANVSVLLGKGVVSIHFQAPPADGPRDRQSPVLAYSVTINPGGRNVTFTGRKIVLRGTFDTIDGLKPGVSYTFSVAAINSAGEGTPAVVGPVTVQ